MPIIHLSLILLRSNPPLKTLITCERVNSFEWQTLIESLNNHTLSYQEGEFSSQVKFMPKYTYVQYTTRWAYYSHELFWIESQSVAITLGSFDNLKQELTTVDFRAKGMYRDVGGLVPTNFVKYIVPVPCRMTMEDGVCSTIVIKSWQAQDWLDGRLSSIFLASSVFDL